MFLTQGFVRVLRIVWWRRYLSHGIMRVSVRLTIRRSMTMAMTMPVSMTMSMASRFPVLVFVFSF